MYSSEIDEPGTLIPLRSTWGLCCGSDQGPHAHLRFLAVSLRTVERERNKLELCGSFAEMLQEKKNGAMEEKPLG